MVDSASMYYGGQELSNVESVSMYYRVQEPSNM